MGDNHTLQDSLRHTGLLEEEEIEAATVSEDSDPQFRRDLRRVVAAHRLIASLWGDLPIGEQSTKAERAKHLLLSVIQDHYGCPRNAIEELISERMLEHWKDREFAVPLSGRDETE